MQVSNIHSIRGPLLPGERRHCITLDCITLEEIRALDPGPMHPDVEPIDPADVAAQLRAAISLGALDELPDLVADVTEISGPHEAVLAAEQRARQAWLELEAAALELAAALDEIAD